MKFYKTLYFLFIFSFHLLNFSGCKANAPAKDSSIAPKPDNPKENVLQPLMKLPKELKECSGMEALGDNKFVAHNDSGNKPYLYVFNTNGKKETRIVKVTNVKNNDWEELASDDKYIYIGDTGNNGGTRQNLMIYKVSKDDILKKDEVEAEIISFRYEGQTKFNDSNRHNFDCEAMICKGDSIFLFSKNRGDFRTDVYGFPKVPGDYVTHIMGSFDSEGLVTGADYRQNGLDGELVLVGYSIHGKAVYPFTLYFPKVKGSDFLSGEVYRHDYRTVLQTESILFHGKNTAYITNEEFDSDDGYRSDGYIYEAGLK